MEQVKYCHGCGKELHISAKQCPNCGATILKSNGKSKTTAGLLAFFLGGIGAHQFYIGNSFLGIMYILFCWTFIPGIIAFFEALNFWIMSEEEFESKFKK